MPIGRLVALGTGREVRQCDDPWVTDIQTADEISGLLARLKDDHIAALQVLGINSLKSHSPMPDALVGEQVVGSAVHGRTCTIETSNYNISVDLQRTGRLVWLAKAVPQTVAATASRPTVRVVLSSGAGLDLSEPAKTKRITVTLSVR